METIVDKDTIKSIKRAIEAILDNKIQIKEKPTVTSINIQDKDIFNDPIKFYECIQKEIDYCAYKLSLKKKATFVQKLDFLHYIMTFLNYQERNYEIYKSNEMKLLFIFIAGVLEKSKIDFDSFKNMSAILHNQIQIEDNKYSILFANQIKEELIIYNKEREQSIQEIVKERKNEIQKINTYLLCSPNYDTIKDDVKISTIITVKDKIPNLPDTINAFYSNLTKKEFTLLNEDRLNLESFDFFIKNEGLFKYYQHLLCNGDNMKLVLMHYARKYYKNEIDYFKTLNELKDDCYITTSNIEDVVNILKSSEIRTKFQDIINSKLFSSFYENDPHGQACLSAYINFKEQMKSIDEVNAFFDKYIHIVVLSQGYKAITNRYLNIFINGSNFSLSKTVSAEEKKQLEMTFLLIVLFHELTHLLLRREHSGENASEYSTIKVSNCKEGGEAFCRYVFGQEYLTTITLKQSIIFLEPSNWNMKVEVRVNQDDEDEEDSDEDNSSNETELMWLITITFKKNQSSSKNITFMNNSIKKKGWCLRID